MAQTEEEEEEEKEEKEEEGTEEELDALGVSAAAELCSAVVAAESAATVDLANAVIAEAAAAAELCSAFVAAVSAATVDMANAVIADAGAAASEKGVAVATAVEADTISTADSMAVMTGNSSFVICCCDF